MATEETRQFVEKAWDDEVVPIISEYITIPNVSPVYDNEWATNGLIEKAADLLFSWAEKQTVKGMKIEMLQLEGLTPLIYIEVPATDPTSDVNLLMYGHLDKQPPLTESWDEGLHPYKPVIRDGKLYGRGGADDGYAIFASLLSVKALQLQGLPHGRIVALIEASEESGSMHLFQYVDHLKEKIGTPSLVVCLDSGCGDYERLWTTTSLRGLVAGNLRVKVLNEGVHSGKASGIVPSSFRIARMLLNRIENVDTGEVTVPELHTEIPAERAEQIKLCAGALAESTTAEFPFAGTTGPVSGTVAELITNRTWKPALSTTGVDGMPTLEKAGNVLRTHTALTLSIRLPPTVNSATASAALKKVLEADPPYGAEVEFEVKKSASGWNAPEFKPWLVEAMDKASKFFWNKPSNYLGEGGTIPLMGVLYSMFPESEFLVTGLLGPASNAHGPNEFMHIQMGKNLTGAVASILTDHYAFHSKK